MSLCILTVAVDPGEFLPLGFSGVGRLGRREEENWGVGFITPNMLCAVVPGCTYAWDSQHMAWGPSVAGLAAVSTIF